MRVRSLRGQEGELFLEVERQNIYPFLLPEELQQWIDGEGHYETFCYVLEGNKSEFIGGAVFEIQDHLSQKEVLLQLDAMFIAEPHRRKGLGSKLLREAIEAVRSECEKRGFNPIGLLVQTTSKDEGATIFYRTVFGSQGFGLSSFCEITKIMRGREITVFLIAFP